MRLLPDLDNQILVLIIGKLVIHKSFESQVKPEFNGYIKLEILENNVKWLSKGRLLKRRVRRKLIRGS